VPANLDVSLSVDEPWPSLRCTLARGEATPPRGADFPSDLAGLPERLPRRYLGEGGHLAWQAFRIRLSLLGRVPQLE